MNLKTGARGLRRVLEKTMLDIMYSIPEEKDSVKEIIITKGVVEHNEQPMKVMKKYIQSSNNEGA